MATVVSKRYDAAAAKIDGERQYTVEEAIDLLKQMPGAKFDESVDLSFRLGRRPQARRPDGAGRRGPPPWPRADRAGGRLRQGREGARGARGRGRRGRRRGPRGAHPGRLDGVRHHRRHARPHGAGGTPGQGARTARAHAEPQARHRDLRRGRARCARPRRARSSTGSTRRATCTSPWASGRSGPSSSRPTP